ncbi:MAG TPA: PIN domain-containing protein [Planctomycetaceae bacterium]|nr:PIN domain-containing protein [Planctomycetaceae bacterium]
MGLIIDTNVFIRAERAGHPPDVSRWAGYGEAYLSVVTVAELLIGVHRADNDARRARRSAFVEEIIRSFPVLDFNTPVARVHAELFASLAARGELIGPHDPFDEQRYLRDLQRVVEEYR